MNRLTHKIRNLKLRKQRVRSTVYGTTERPRLSVHVSNRHINVQVVDDQKHDTLVYISTIGKKEVGKTLTEKAGWAGKEIAKKAKAKKIKQVVFDRNGRLYHGRVKVLADAAREAGLEF